MLYFLLAAGMYAKGRVMMRGKTGYEGRTGKELYPKLQLAVLERRNRRDYMTTVCYSCGKFVWPMRMLARYSGLTILDNSSGQGRIGAVFLFFSLSQFEFIIRRI